MNALAERLSGSCLCGEVQLEIAAPLLSMGNCHCSMCRHQHGSPFATYAKSLTASVTLTRGAAEVQRYDSSARASREFCARCGTKLFYRQHAAPEYVWIAAGVFDDDPGIAATYHIYTADKAPWHETDDELDTFPGRRPAAEHG